MRICLFLFFAFTLFSCQQKTSEKNSKPINSSVKKFRELEQLKLKDSLIYLSAENDLALIKLTLIPDETFNFYMSIFPNPLQKISSEPSVIKATGTWSGSDKTILLNFAKRKKDTLHLNALFDIKYKEGNEFKVIDDHTVEIDYTREKINIWGIGCYKTLKNNPN